MSPNGEHGLTTEPVGEFVVKKSSVWWWRTLVSLHLPQKISSILKNIWECCWECVRVAAVPPNGRDHSVAAPHTSAGIWAWILTDQNQQR